MHRGGNLLCEGTLFGGVPQVIGEHLDDGPAQLPQTSTFLLVPHILFAEATVMIAIIFNSDFVLWISHVNGVGVSCLRYGQSVKHKRLACSSFVIGIRWFYELQRRLTTRTTNNAVKGR